MDDNVASGDRLGNNHFGVFTAKLSSGDMAKRRISRYSFTMLRNAPLAPRRAVRQLTPNRNHALFMSEITARPGISGANVAELLNIDRASIHSYLPTLRGQELLSLASPPASQPKRPGLKQYAQENLINMRCAPTDVFQGKAAATLNEIPGELSSAAMAIYEDGQDSRRTMDDVPMHIRDHAKYKLAWLRTRAHYLGSAAVLARQSDLTDFSDWWTGAEGWQAAITIAAAGHGLSASTPLREPVERRLHPDEGHLPLTGNTADALVMSAIHVQAEQITYRELVEPTGLGRHTVDAACGRLARRDLLEVTRGKRKQLHVRATSCFEENLATLRDNLSELPGACQALYSDAVRECTYLRQESSAAPVLEILQSEVTCLGSIAVLGEQFNLNRLAPWWGSQTGWQALVSIESGMTISA